MSITINGMTGIAGVDGSAATPSVQGADANTGVFFPAADTVAITTGGTERMRIDSSGNVGIGTSSPLVKLDITGQGRATTGFAVGPDQSSFTPSGLNAIPNYGNGYLTTGAYTALSGFGGVSFYTNQLERLQVGQLGQLGIGGANYGTSGQVLTSGGSGAAPSWTSRAMASTVMTAKSRATGTSYQNTTSGWLFVAFASVNNGASATVGATSPGNSVTACTSNANGTGGSFMVPPGWYYIINVNTMSFTSEGQA